MWNSGGWGQQLGLNPPALVSQQWGVRLCHCSKVILLCLSQEGLAQIALFYVTLCVQQTDTFNYQAVIPSWGSPGSGRACLFSINSTEVHKGLFFRPHSRIPRACQAAFMVLSRCFSACTNGRTVSLGIPSSGLLFSAAFRSCGRCCWRRGRRWSCHTLRCCVEHLAAGPALGLQAPVPARKRPWFL